MSSDDRILALLARYVSAPTARSALRLARQRMGIARDERVRVAELGPHVERAISLFVSASVRAQIKKDLLDLDVGVLPELQVVKVVAEADVARARDAVRKLGMRASASSLNLQKAVTAVSELARNIFMYTTGGTISLSLAKVRRRTVLHVEAVDHGPGIGNLDEVLAGSYRSKKGLGRGLRGVKRISSAFDIDTSSNGTRITAELDL